MQSKITNKMTIFIPDCRRQRQFCMNQTYLFDQSFSVYAQLLESDSLKKIDFFKMIQLHRYWQNIEQYRKMTILKDVLPNYQAILPSALHTEVWSCV